MSQILPTAVSSTALTRDHLSERLVAHLREDEVEEFSHTSPYAACLLPLLDALGWRDYTRDLLEALPYRHNDFDLVDLRNVLVSMGYESHPTSSKIRQLNSELLPCLFETSNHRLLVITDICDGEYRYYDPRDHQWHTGDAPCDESGVAYVFTDTHFSHNVSDRIPDQLSWFVRLMLRFKPTLLHLLGVTFFINFISLSVPLFILVIYDKVIGTRSVDALGYLVAGVAIAMLTDLSLRLLRARVVGAVAGRLDYLVGVEVFKQILYLPPLYTERSGVGAQLSRLRQFDSIRDFFTGSSASAVIETPFIFLFVGVIAILAGWIALIPVAMVLVYVALALTWLPLLDKKIARAGSAKGLREQSLVETVAGRREIKASAAENAWRERFRETSGDAMIASFEMSNGNAALTAVAQSLMSATGVAVLGFGTLAVIAGDITMGALIATMALVWRVLTPLQNLFLAYAKLKLVLRSVAQINQLMQISVEPHTNQAALLLPTIRGAVSLDRVSFRYVAENDPALVGVSLKVEPGEFVAVVGNTGAGKSTLLKLIAGMYRPQGGVLAIDDANIRQLNAMELRRAIAYVPQKPRLFNATVAENLRLKNILATDEELVEAAASAGILETITALPQGFHTPLGNNAADRLPAGFAHGLTMARAFVRRAPIILLDEPGASIDIPSDMNLVRQLSALKGKRTILMVSHRPSHIRLADKALLLNQGGVAFAGNPQAAIDLMLGSR